MREEVKLGNLIEGEASRDAIHIAVAPVIAAEPLSPGQHVGLNQVGQATSHEPHLGIVDPFLPAGPAKGDRFFLCLYPQSITSLRHEWTHPSFAPLRSSEINAAERAESERWLREYASEMSPRHTADTAFAQLIAGLRSGHLFADGTDLRYLSDLVNADELRMHAERYLEIPIHWSDFSFNCSC